MREPAPDPAWAVELRDVSLKRGGVTVLEGISLALPHGRTTAVLGESGSGKSTLIELVIGLLRPDTGTVTTLGQPIDYADPRPLRRRIGYAIQDVSLFPHLSVRDNIVLPGTLDGWSQAEKAARLDVLLELMHLPESVLDRFPHELSGGQQQRAGLCRAMWRRPELLLLDEPFSGLDALTRRSIHAEFRELQARAPVSSVLVTHDPAEALALADRLVIMKSGRIEQSGPVAEVTSHPASAYVHYLIGAPDPSG
jgi:osmoprotectant transport system ATP-binding protein